MYTPSLKIKDRALKIKIQYVGVGVVFLAVILIRAKRTTPSYNHPL
jgi:hypothetical protein